MLIPVAQWATRFAPIPHRNTLQKWAREGSIFPRPVKAGKAYYVSPDACLLSEIVMGRRRSRHADLPPNLYCSDGYYYWRNPKTRKASGIGRDKHQAIAQAIAANLHLQGASVTLVDRLTGAAERTVDTWCDAFDKSNPGYRLKYLREGLGNQILSKLKPLQINQWLDRWADKPRMRQQQLGIAKTVFAEAIGKGWLDSNPASELTTPAPQTKRQRLTIEAYKAIHAKASPILQRAMEVALMAPMRRGGVTRLQWSQIRDGFVWVEHAKGGLKVRIPLALYLPETGWTLGDVIGRCRDAVVSRYVLHHSKAVGRAKAGDKIRDKTIERLFREARMAAGIDSANPPTFHEIRSLAARIWNAHGVNVKVLLGHTTDKMSALYKDSRGAEWVTLVNE